MARHDDATTVRRTSASITSPSYRRLSARATTIQHRVYRGHVYIPLRNRNCAPSNMTDDRRSPLPSLLGESQCDRDVVDAPWSGLR